MLKNNPEPNLYANVGQQNLVRGKHPVYPLLLRGLAFPLYADICLSPRPILAYAGRSSDLWLSSYSPCLPGKFTSGLLWLSFHIQRRDRIRITRNSLLRLSPPAYLNFYLLYLVSLYCQGKNRYTLVLNSGTVT